MPGFKGMSILFGGMAEYRAHLGCLHSRKGSFGPGERGSVRAAKRREGTAAWQGRHALSQGRGGLAPPQRGWKPHLRNGGNAWPNFRRCGILPRTPEALRFRKTGHSLRCPPPANNADAPKPKECRKRKRDTGHIMPQETRGRAVRAPRAQGTRGWSRAFRGITLYDREAQTLKPLKRPTTGRGPTMGAR